MSSMIIELRLRSARAHAELSESFTRSKKFKVKTALRFDL
jgi:hypothetical protein